MQVPAWYDGDVSRETLDQLDAYAALIRKWTPKINLIARSTLEALEDRHIWDSAQAYYPREGEWIDLGSGGGMPGVVVAILAQGEGRNLQVTLIESDQRKATFLRTCARELELQVTVRAERIEKSGGIKADVVSARALANLNTLLVMSEPLMKPDAECVFMKGAQWKSEIAQAQRNWRFSYEAKPSMTNTEAVIIQVKDIERV